MPSGIQLPLEVAAALCGLFALMGAGLGNWHAGRRNDPRRNPLNEMLKPENLRPAIELAVHRDARRRASHAVLQGRIDQFAESGADWSADTHEQVREHVAAVMRVGLRRDDRISLADGDGFTILVPGADERAAVHIADRLRRKVGNLHLPQLGEDFRLTASFGVAADRFGESREGLGSRAHRALGVAIEQGIDHVVPASEIEEIMLLPAPVPTSVTSASAG